MKKLLLLSLVTSSLFSMQLAHKLQTPYKKRSNTIKSALIKAEMSRTVSNEIDVKTVRINPSSVRTPHRLGDVELYHDKNGFIVLQDNKKHVIEKRFMDPTSRTITKEQLKSFLKLGYFTLNQTNDGTFTLKAHHRLTGGGVGGATTGFYIGKFITYFVCHGAIVVVAGLTGPAAPATFAGLEGCLAPHIELASQVTSLAGGMIGAVITGPV